MRYTEIVSWLESHANKQNVIGMARFGIKGGKVLGISMWDLRKFAKQIKKDHDLALKLWDSGIHEAHILASVLDEKEKITEKQMEAWVKDIDSWDVCDQVMGNLFCYSPLALAKVEEWSKREPEFEKRSAFSLLAYVAIHRKKDISDAQLLKFLPLIKREATDERNFVKKAVNWALRQIGKRSDALLKPTLKLAQELAESEDKTARWVGKDAMRELSKRV